MGVKKEEWIIYGQKYPYSTKLADQVRNINQYSDEESDIVALVDGMNGQYIIIGFPLEIGDEYEGLEQSEYSIEELEEYKKEIIPLISNLDIEKSSSIPYKLHILSHFS